MSATFADFDANGRMDVFVTNDNLPNFLFLNQEDGRFTEDALLAGTALLDHGRPVASMGVDIGDYDDDGFRRPVGDGTEQRDVPAVSRRVLGELFAMRP